MCSSSDICTEICKLYAQWAKPESDLLFFLDVDVAHGTALWVAGVRGVRVMLRARELEPRHEEEQSQRLLTVVAEHVRARSALSLVPVRVVDATA